VRADLRAIERAGVRCDMRRRHDAHAQAALRARQSEVPMPNCTG
jgi:hypothetical protein